MSRRFKISLILSLSCLLLNTLALAQQISCDPNNRPTNCNNIPFKRVCSHYTNDCPFEICGKPESNACEACKNPNTIYYEIGECAPSKVIQRCFAWEVDECYPGGDIQNPFCGIKNENGQIISQTFNTRCELCGPSSSFRYFQYDACEKDKNYCDKKYCQKGTVCALFPTENFGTVYSPVSSASLACSDPELGFFLKGDCAPLLDDRTHCLPNARPQNCPAENNPVCGFYKNEKGWTLSRMVDSPCEACSDPAIQYHLPSCEFTCHSGAGEEEESHYCEWNKNPICGTYIENGQEKRVSLLNDCVGCYESGYDLVSYVHGLCPGDEDNLPDYGGEGYE